MNNIFLKGTFMKQFMCAGIFVCATITTSIKPMTIRVIEQIDPIFVKGSVSMFLDTSLVVLMQNRLADHPEVTAVKPLPVYFRDTKQLVSVVLKNKIDQRNFLDKKPLNNLLRSDKQPSAGQKNNIKHILNSLLYVTECLERGYLTYNDAQKRFYLDAPVLKTPTPDVTEFYDSMSDSLSKCFKIIGCPPNS
jgi:hypothetical protein